MKLNLLFVAMDLFTVLAYPLVFVYSQIVGFQKGKAVIQVVAEGETIASITS